MQTGCINLDVSLIKAGIIKLKKMLTEIETRLGNNEERIVANSKEMCEITIINKFLIDKVTNLEKGSRRLKVI